MGRKRLGMGGNYLFNTHGNIVFCSCEKNRSSYQLDPYPPSPQNSKIFLIYSVMIRKANYVKYHLSNLASGVFYGKPCRSSRDFQNIQHAFPRAKLFTPHMTIFFFLLGRYKDTWGTQKLQVDFKNNRIHKAPPKTDGDKGAAQSRWDTKAIGYNSAVKLPFCPPVCLLG